ncbi:MAG: hypothetical protein H6726_02680 [Sandaracinaceae bacterium]|nr:hypothetical protein [Sandaracinaceae bacterium]
MRQRAMVGPAVLWLVLLGALASPGCSTPTPGVTTPPVEPEVEAPGTLLVDESLPAPAARAAGPEALGRPVFQAGHSGSVRSLDISPDGRLALVATYGGEVSVLDFETGDVRASRRMWVQSGALRAPHFDPTGTRVLLHGNGVPYATSLFVWDLLTDTLVPGETGDLYYLPAAHMSPDGALVVSLEPPGLAVRDAATLEVRRALVPRNERGQLLVPTEAWVSPSMARFIAARVQREEPDASQRTTIIVPSAPRLGLYDAAGELVDTLVPAQPSPSAPTGPGGEQPASGTSSAGMGFRGLAFRPTGGLLMTLTDAGDVQLRDPLTGALRHTVDLPGTRARTAHWLRSGERLLVWDTQRADPRVAMVHFVDPASGAVVATVETGWPLESTRGPDGETLVYSLSRLSAFDLNGQPRPHPLAPFVQAREYGFEPMYVTPAGDRMIYVDEGAIHLVDLRRGEQVAERVTRPGPESVWGALFVPGEGVLVTNRYRGVLYRPSGVRRVDCAMAGAELRGEGRTLRVHSAVGDCALVGDAAAPAAEAQEEPQAVRDARGMVYQLSANESVGLGEEDDETVAVWDMTTGRRRMRVPVSARSGEACPDCPASYTFSPDGSRLAVHGPGLPVTNFDTRNGRRVSRLTSAGRGVDWLEWSPDGSSLAVFWTPLESDEPPEGPSDDAAEPPPRPWWRMTLYDGRGRELVSVDQDPELGREPFAVFEPQRAIVVFGDEVRVVDLRTRAVWSLRAEHPIDGAVFHGSVLHLTLRVGADSASVTQALYAAGAATPYFQSEGSGDFTSDARFLFRCREGELQRLRVEDLAQVSFGACTAERYYPRADGRFVAMPQGDHLRIVREDGASVRLGALTNAPVVVAYVVDEATGRFTAYGVDPDTDRIRYRQAGPGTTAPVVPLSEATDAQDAQVLQRFLEL